MIRIKLKPDGCQTWIHKEQLFWSHQCKRKPIVIRDGQAYCKIHDPEYIKAKQDKADKEWDEQFARMGQLAKIEGERIRVLKGFTLAELEQLTPELIRTLLQKEE